MMVSRLILKNWKNFKSADISLSSRTFAMGPNGVGKSNFLDAIRFLADIARPGGGICYALQARGGLEKIRFSPADYHEHSPHFLKDDIRPVTASEIVLLMPGSYKEGTMAFLASTFPPIISDMKKGLEAYEIIPDYIVPIGSLDMLLDFMGLDLFPDDEH